MDTDLIDQHVPTNSAYAFLREHSRAVAGGELVETCKTDGEAWPCLPARAFLAGRRSGLDIAADRLENLAEGFTGSLGVQRVRQVAAHLRVDADEIDQGLRAEAARVRQHPLSNCGPLMMDLPEGQRCPTCGVPAGTEPSAETLAEIRKLWPTYPEGFWRS